MTEHVQESFICTSSPVTSGRGGLLVLLTIAASAGTYARFSVGPLQESMRIALALSDNQIAVLQGPALALPVMIGAIPLGILIDRHSRVRLLFVFALLTFVGCVLTGIAPNFTLLLLARALVGLTTCAIPIATYSLVADLFEPAQRGRANMVMAVGQAGATSAAFALGGVLLVMSDLGPVGWRWAMLWMAAPLLPLLFLTLVMREPPRSGIAIARPSARVACAELWRYRAVIMPLLAGLVIVEVSVGAAVTWAAPMLARRFTLPPDRVGAIMATMFLISGLVGPVAGGMLADFCQRRGGPRRTITVLSGLTVLTVPAGLFAVAPSIALASGLLIVFNTIVNAIAMAVMTLSTVVIPNELRGLFLATLTVMAAIFAFVLAPLTVSLLSGAMGGPDQIGAALATVCVTTCLLGAAAFALGTRYFPRTAV